MTKIFRNIRKQLAAENKIPAYLRYAIGEILLVVIGILIALQVNNWNEARKLNIHLKSTYCSLYADLVQDTVQIAERLVTIKNDVSQLKNFKQRMSSNQANLDTLRQIAEFEYDPHITIDDISFNTNSWESLKATGNLSNVPVWLQNGLITLNQMQQTYLISARVNVQSYLQQADAYSLKYPFHDTGNILPNSKLGKAIWHNTSFAELGAYMNGLYGEKNAAETASIHRLQKIMNKTKELIIKLSPLCQENNQKQ